MHRHIQEQTIKNKESMELASADQQAQQREYMRNICEDPVQRREYMLRQAMITSVEEADSIQ